MSDRDDLDTLNLDVAFDHLSADVDSHTRARSAERAIRSAGHRRLATAGGALAVVAVLAGVLVGTLGLPGNQSAPPVATPTSNPLPEPRTFDATAFNDATAGWTRGWMAGTSPIPTDLPCDPYSGERPEPLDISTSTFWSAGPHFAAIHTVARFDTPEHAAEGYLKQVTIDNCRGEFFELRDEIWDGGESVVYGVKLGDETVYELVVVHETELAVLRVVGQDNLPEDVRKHIVLALLADLRT
jgi:hypothetical protein